MPRELFYPACPVCEDSGHLPVVEYDELTFVRCAACGLVYKREQLRRLGVGYEEEYFRHNRARYLHRWDHRVRKCRRQLLACLEFAPHARDVLDIGCSAGYVLEAARSLGLHPTGLDVSAFAVNLCRERGFTAEQGVFEQMPFADGSFDIVVTKHTLEHIRDPMQGLREIFRVLRPGGVAFIIVPDGAYYKMAVMPRRGRSFRPDRRGWQHHVYFYEHNLAEACRRVGLEPAKAGKDVFRRRLARGPATGWELLRYAFLVAWTATCRVTRFRREIQLICRRPAEPALLAPAAPPRLAG